MMHALYRPSLTLLCSLLSCCLPLFAAEPALKAGAAKVDITPPVGISIAGSMHANSIKTIHDPLYARALCLDDGQTQLALVLVDNCLIPRSLFDAAKALVEAECQIPHARQLMAATHSHSAPTVTPVFMNDPDPDYVEFLIRRIADSVAAAQKNLAEAKIAWGSATLTDEVFNRRWYMNPEAIPADPFGGKSDQVKMNPPRASEDLIRNAGPTDPEISFIALESLSGAPIALLANYSLHYVGGVGGGHVSADYFGVFCQKIEALLGAGQVQPEFVGILSNGTSGDINNINFRDPGKRQQPYEQMTLVANKVAAKVQEAYAGLDWQRWVPLNAATKEIHLGVRKPSKEEVRQAQATLDKIEQITSMPEIYARETVLISKYPDTVPLIIQALRIGSLSIAAAPCEVFAEIGLEIKAKSPFDDAFTIELANGYNGYLPTPAQHQLGGYETWRARSSYLEEEASVKITRTLLELFEELKAS